MIPWWPIVFSFIGALIVAAGWACTVQGWPRYVIIGGTMLAALGALGFAIDQVSYQTGGESFGYVRPSFLRPLTPKDYTAEMWVMHQGQHPLSDLNIHVVDIEKFQEQSAQNPQGLLFPGPYDYRYTLPRLEPQTMAMGFPPLQLPKDRDEQDYNIWINSTRNLKRGVFQQLRFRRIDGEWWIALRVIRDDQVLIEQGRQYLPRDEKGQAIWEKGTSRWAR